MEYPLTLIEDKRKDFRRIVVPNEDALLGKEFIIIEIPF
jgi:hypothetical protein